MKIVKSVAELRKIRRNIESLGFVPTMGALHQGHCFLIKKSVSENQSTLVSIFVNPKQFNDEKDFKTYPNTLDSDLKMCEESGVDYVFLPSLDEMYADTDSIFIVENNLSKKFEGEKRPGHFDGVLLVLTKLLNIVRANVIYMGEKDYQQAELTKKLCKELFIDTRVQTVETFRDESGLPFSSRNSKLTSSGLSKAKVIAKQFHSTKSEKEFLAGLNVELDYYGQFKNKIVMAHRVEGVRLLDNKEA